MKHLKNCNLEELQDLREKAVNKNKSEIQKAIDDYFLKSEKTNKKQEKKRKRRIKNEDDLWW